MKGALGLVLTIWVAVLSIVVLQEPSLAQRPRPPPARPPPSGPQPTFSVNLAERKPGGSHYKTFLSSLRSYLGRETVRGVLMMAEPGPPAFFRVELKASDKESITLAMEKNYLYVVGYKTKVKVRVNNKEVEEERAYFFKDHKERVEKLVFKEVTTKPEKINYVSSYAGLEGKAGSRENVKLGIGKLQKRVENLYGVAKVEEKIQAECLLIAVQTIAEAARFSYIETQIVNNIGIFEFTPDAKVLNLVKEWAKISKAIRGLEDNQDTFEGSLTIKNALGPGKDWVVTRLDQLVPDVVALLKYEPKPKQLGLLSSSSSSSPLSLYFPRILMIFLGIDDASADDDQPINNIPPVLLAA